MMVPGTALSNSGNAGISPNQQALVCSCLAIVEEHQKGNITHAQATVQIFSTLPGDKFRTKVFVAYVKQLSQTDRDKLIASVRGASTPIAPPAPSTGSNPIAGSDIISGSDTRPLIERQPDTSSQVVANLKRSAN